MYLFKKATHETTGEIAVSNGTVRVCDGASFPHLSLVTVRGANARFQVDATAVMKMPVTTLAISDGGKIKPEAGTHLDVAAVTVNGVAVADGIYSGAAALHATQVDWIDGVGVVCVGHGVPGAAQVDAAWTGGGSVNSGSW